VKAVARRALAFVVAHKVAVATCLVCAALTVTVVLVALRDSALDFYVYYLAADLAAHGRSAYTVGEPGWNTAAHAAGVVHFTAPYRYPPYTEALVRTLVPLGPFRAMLAWEAAAALALVAGALLLGRTLGGGWRSVLTLGLLLVFVPAYHTLLNGQVNALVFLALAVAFWGLTRRRDLPLGAGIAVAAALKLTPAILILYLLWRRRWRAALVSLATLGLLSLAALPAVGAEAFPQYASRAVTLTAPQRIDVSPQNQTAEGAIGRLLAEKTSWTHAVFRSLERAAVVRWSAAAFGAALLSLTAVALWPRRVATPGRAGEDDAHRPALRASRPTPREDQLGFGMVLAVSLVIGPFTFFHQFLWLMFLIVTMADGLLAHRRWGLLMLLAAGVLLIDLNELLWVGSLWLGVFHHLWRWPYEVVAANGRWRALSLPFAVTVGLWVWAQGVVVAGRRRRASEAASSLPPGMAAR
jgi:hypothetical protein